MISSLTTTKRLLRRSVETKIENKSLQAIRRKPTLKNIVKHNSTKNRSMSNKNRMNELRTNDN
eukprot:3283947-Heterocapsa_arctica.AAC.1